MYHLPHPSLGTKSGENTCCTGCKQIEEEDYEGGIAQAQVVREWPEHSKRYAIREGYVSDCIDF